jgi:hypothetical protein
VVEGTGLENQHTFTRIEGSNPSLSAIGNSGQPPWIFYCRDVGDDESSGFAHRAREEERKLVFFLRTAMMLLASRRRADPSLYATELSSISTIGE